MHFQPVFTQLWPSLNPNVQFTLSQPGWTLQMLDFTLFRNPICAAAGPFQGPNWVQKIKMNFSQKMTPDHLGCSTCVFNLFDVV